MSEPRVETFCGSLMITKLFRTIRMNFLRRKKCFHDRGLTELKAWGSRDFVFGTALDGVALSSGACVSCHTSPCRPLHAPYDHFPARNVRILWSQSAASRRLHVREGPAGARLGLRQWPAWRYL